MLTFDGFQMQSGIPIYIQIVQYIQRGIAAGTIADGAEMPSRRVLSARLGVNPNTIQKAYRLLEDEGLIVSHAGAKSLVTYDAAAADRLRRSLLAQDVRQLVTAMRQTGLSKEEALDLVERLWEEEEA